MDNPAIIKLTRKEIAKRELSFLKQDWKPLEEALVSTVTDNPLAIFDLVLFVPTVILSALGSIIRVTWGQ